MFSENELKMFSENELKILIKDQKKNIENIEKEAQYYYDRTVGNGQHYICILDKEYVKLEELEEQIKKK